MWNISFTVTFRDRSIKEVGIVKDDSGSRITAGTDIDLDMAIHLPKFVDFLTSIGINSVAVLPVDVTDYVFRFSAITTNGHVNVLGGTDALDNQVVTNDLAGIMVGLLADYDFVKYFAVGSGPTPLSGPKYIWDARWRGSLFLNNASLVTKWIDILRGVPLVPNGLGPLYNGNVLNGEPGVIFDGVNNVLAADVVVPGNFTLVGLVGDIDSFGLIGNYFSMYGSANSGYISMLGQNQVIYVSNGGVPALSLLLYKNVGVIILRQDANQATLWIADSATYITSKSTTVVTGVNLSRLFVSGNLGAGVSGNFMYVALYDSAISLADVNVALSYIANAYNLVVAPAT